MKLTGRAWRWLFALLLILVVGFALFAGRYLVVDDPQHADVIVVLAGETQQRPEKALRLLDQGYAPRMILDVPAQNELYDISQLDLARDYVKRLPEAEKIGICPIVGLSTRDESHDVAKCLSGMKSDRVLIVTSDFHTRRALATFRRELKGRTFFVAAARDDTQFGEFWWEHRQWSKIFLDEWLRIVWWKTIDEWR